MLKRKVWPLTLGIMFVGSAAVIVRAEEATPQSKSPTNPSTSSGPVVAPTPRKPIKPKELSDAVKRGLDYLAGLQNEDGGFGQGGGWRLNKDGGQRIDEAAAKDRSDVGNTCMAALAFIRAGNTPKTGSYSKQLVKAIEFVESNVESADKDSLYVTPVRDTQLQHKIGHYVDTFLTALVLSELKGQMADTKSEERLSAALNKTIGKIETHQKADGTFTGNAGWASVLSQGLCSKALSRASQKGVALKPETIKRDLDQAVAQLDSSKAPVAAGAGAGRDVSSIARSGLGAAVGSSSGKGDAGVSLYFLSSNGSRVQDAVNEKKARKSKVDEVINSPTADDKTKEEARSELKALAQAELANGEVAKQLTLNLADARFVKGFGNNGGEEFLSYMNISETLLATGGDVWDKWDRQVCDTISKIQNEDGSWSGHHCITGRTFCTSAALLTLMADRAPAPPADGK